MGACRHKRLSSSSSAGLLHPYALRAAVCCASCLAVRTDSPGGCTEYGPWVPLPSHLILPHAQAAHADAVANYKALLTEVVRDADVSWREAQPRLSKDPQVCGSRRG